MIYSFKKIVLFFCFLTLCYAVVGSELDVKRDQIVFGKCRENGHYLTTRVTRQNGLELPE